MFHIRADQSTTQLLNLKFKDHSAREDEKIVGIKETWSFYGIMTSRNVREAVPLMAQWHDWLKKTCTMNTPEDMLTYLEESSQGLNPRQRIGGDLGTLWVGEIFFPGKSSQIDYPISSNQPWNHIETWKFTQSEQGESIYFRTCINE